MRVVKHQTRFPSKVADAPRLSVGKRHLEIPSIMLELWVSSGAVRQLDSMVFVGPCQLNYSSLF